MNAKKIKKQIASLRWKNSRSWNSNETALKFVAWCTHDCVRSCSKSVRLKPAWAVRPRSRGPHHHDSIQNGRQRSEAANSVRLGPVAAPDAERKGDRRSDIVQSDAQPLRAFKTTASPQDPKGDSRNAMMVCGSSLFQRTTPRRIALPASLIQCLARQWRAHSTEWRIPPPSPPAENPRSIIPTKSGASGGELFCPEKNS